MISGDYPPIKGGVSDYTKRLFDELKKQLGKKDNIFLITSKGAKKENKNIINKIKKWNFIGLIKTLKLIRKIKPNIIHIQYPTAQYKFNFSINFLPLFLRITKSSTPIISTLHEFSNRSFLGKVRLSINILFSHKILIVSEKYRKDILSFLWPFKKIIKNKLVYIPIGSNILPHKIPSEEIKKTRKKIAKNGETILCYFGAIREEKGIEFLLDTFKIMLKEEKNLKLIFIGQCDGKYGSKIKKITKEKNLSQNIIFTGYLSERDISKYLFSSDICVLPFLDGVSTKRGSFLAPLFHNIPIITTKPDHKLPELINHKNIILIRPNDKGGLKKEIKYLITDKEKINIIKKNSLQLKKRFSWENITKKIISNYYKALDKNKNEIQQE
jgi:glycosyltransferase involved in cell wall biosynthesis